MRLVTKKLRVCDTKATIFASISSWLLIEKIPHQLHATIWSKIKSY